MTILSISFVVYDVLMYRTHEWVREDKTTPQNRAFTHDIPVLGVHVREYTIIVHTLQYNFLKRAAELSKYGYVIVQQNIFAWGTYAIK